MRSVKFVFLSAAAISALVLAGCGGETTHKVTGKVTLADGKPLTNGTVTFQMEGFQAYGTTSADGTYEAEVQPGKYKVVVTQQEESTGGSGDDFYATEKAAAAGPKLKFDNKYTQASTSPLEVEVKGDMDYPIELK